MGLCCCLSLQKGVVVIGVLSVLSSAVITVMYLVTSVTFEEHVSACRLNASRDALGVFPECDVLTDASLLMAARIFIYIQLLAWITEIITSGFLILAAIKKRTNLLIPWVIVTILVVLVLIWNIYEAAFSDSLIKLLLLIITLLITLYFLVIVRSFTKQTFRVERTRLHYHSHEDHHMCHRSSSSSIQTLPSSFDYSKPTNVLHTVDLPPAYTPFNSVKKGPLPKGLGVKY